MNDTNIGNDNHHQSRRTLGVVLPNSDRPSDKSKFTEMIYIESKITSGVLFTVKAFNAIFAQRILRGNKKLLRKPKSNWFVICTSILI